MEIAFNLDRTNPLEHDLLTIKLVPDARIRDLELDLFTSKWFDYRHLTPLQATTHYVDAFNTVYRQKYAEHYDEVAAENLKLADFDTLVRRLDLPGKGTTTKGTISAFWRGRQFADALGMPYHEYVTIAMDFRLRYWQQRYLPKPGHLYDDKLLEQIGQRWHELQAGRLYLAENPLFLCENYQGLPAQDDYHEWIMYQSTIRPAKHQFLAKMIARGQITYEKVAARLMDDELAELNTCREQISDFA